MTVQDPTTLKLPTVPRVLLTSILSLLRGLYTYDSTNNIITLGGSADVGLNLLPAGVMIDYAGTAAPGGWLLCDGSAVRRTTYARLFAVVSTTYGVGNGSTTFNLPDYRGRVSAGLDNMGGTPANRITGAWADTLGGGGGTETHTLSTAELAAHSHGVNINATADASELLATANYLARRDAHNAAETFFVDPSSNAVNTAMIANAGGGGAHNNMQPSMAAAKIIRY